MSIFGSPLWLMVFWLFAIGAAVGSFMNVVVYRLPLGLSLVYPPSHCPKCQNRIPWYDNVPIFGWIMLRGRCRQCHNPISARYPIIEAVTATMFALVATVEIYQINTIYPYHMLLLCTLLSTALIEFDGNRPPLRLFLPAFVVGLVAPVFWPALQLLVIRWAAPAPFTGVVGLAAGALLGDIVWLIRRSPKPTGLMFGLMCVGLFLGWQAVVIIAAGVAVLSAISWLLGWVFPKLRVPASMLLIAATLVWILTWAANVWPR
jgi:leader peptidase (prepilin peptidase) / N-methyltransferase